MNYFDNEEHIVDWLKDMSDSVFVNSNKAKKIYKKIINDKKWSNWINSSKKSDPPPDFYSDHYKLMMDVMRVDDHTRKNKKGKLYNPFNAHENELYKELKERGIEDGKNGNTVIINGVTQLPTEEDHNFKFYKSNFKRVVSEHIKHIPNYKSNHPGYKVIFLIFDESTAYLQAFSEEEYPKDIVPGGSCCGNLHWWFLDQDFINCFIDSGIDYVIWFSPYKYVVTSLGSVNEPNTAVLEVAKLKKEKLKKYNDSLMFSAEA